MSQNIIEAWRLVAICNMCETHILLFRNVPERLSRIGGNYATTCPSCGHNGSFSVGRIRDGEEESVKQQTEAAEENNLNTSLAG